MVWWAICAWAWKRRGSWADDSEPHLCFQRGTVASFAWQFSLSFLLCSTDEQHLRGTCGDLLHVEHSGGEATSTNLARTGLPSSREGIAFTLSALVTYEDCIPHPVGCNVDAGVDRTTGMEKNYQLRSKICTWCVTRG